MNYVSCTITFPLLCLPGSCIVTTNLWNLSIYEIPCAVLRRILMQRTI
jgi:hypothetical protein